MNEEQFLRKTREQLDASEQALDASILSRLNQARQKALAQNVSNKWNLRNALWIPATVTATLAIALIAGNVLLQQPSDENMAQQFTYEDIEILISDADIDLLEDMDMLEAMADDAS
jgi:hypothetical protein